MRTADTSELSCRWTVAYSFEIDLMAINQLEQ